MFNRHRENSTLDPEEVLRTLIEAELAARDAADRLKAVTFPVLKTLDNFDVAASSIPQATLDYLTSLERIRTQQNLALIGPPVTCGTGPVLINVHDELSWRAMVVVVACNISGTSTT